MRFPKKYGAPHVASLATKSRTAWGVDCAPAGGSANFDCWITGGNAANQCDPGGNATVLCDVTGGNFT